MHLAISYAMQCLKILEYIAQRAKDELRKS